jgi:predicted nucleic acid-binding protein
MNPTPALVLDANILIRAVLGKRVRSLIETYAEHVHFFTVVESTLYVHFEEDARTRMVSRDEDDWPVTAVALALDSPIWTEDRDFFGIGIATWTTDRVELYLRR